MSLIRKYSWPFKWTVKTKYIQNQMEYQCINVRDKAAPIILRKKDYDTLMEIVAPDYPCNGRPCYNGREVVREV